VSEKRLKGIAALLVTTLLAVITVGALIGSSSAADDLQAQADRALAAADLDGVDVTFHGREAELSGATADDLGKAELIVEGIEGVRWADIVPSAGGTPTTGPPDTTPTLDLRRTDTGITIRGTVPDADAAASIKAGVAEAFAVPVTGDLMINRAVGTARWIDQLPDVFGDIVGVKRLELKIDGSGTLDLSGSIESRAGADDVRRLLAAAVPQLDVVNRLDVRPGDLSDEDATILNSSTLFFSPGSTDVEADNRRMLDTVAEVLHRNGDIAIEAGGYVGPDDPATGEAIALARVAAVKAYLVRAGVSAARISTRTFASGSQTAKPTAKQFRRVEFIVSGS
jgi:outer membrane protein OmpA-like peptidoglycan-associated protein